MTEFPRKHYYRPGWPGFAEIIVEDILEKKSKFPLVIATLIEKVFELKIFETLKVELKIVVNFGGINSNFSVPLIFFDREFFKRKKVLFPRVKE
jgi:hypothetical protein